MEFFIAWYSGNPYERSSSSNRMMGDVLVGVLVDDQLQRHQPQLFWFKKRLRTNIPAMFVISIVINIGMWFERFVIIVTSLHHDFLPSAWG